MQRYDSYLKPLFKKYYYKYHILLMHFVLLISIPSEISILSNSKVYNSFKNSSKKTWGSYVLSSLKTDLTITVNTC